MAWNYVTTASHRGGRTLATGPAEHDEFDAARFAALWQAAAPALRRRLARHGLPPRQVEQLLGAVLVAMLEARRLPETQRAFIKYADAIGNRRALALVKRRSDLRDRLRHRRATMGYVDRSAASDFEDEAERRAVVHDALRRPEFAALPPGARRTAWLIVRGGELTKSEQQLVWRNRPKVVEFFYRVVGELGVAWLWLRGRLARVDPLLGPALTCTAAVVAAASIGHAICAHPAKADADGSVVVALVVKRVTSTVITIQPAATGVHGRAGDRSTSASLPPRGATRHAPTRAPVQAVATATLPSDGRPGNADIAIAIIPADAEVWSNHDQINCDSELRGMACNVLSKAPRASGPSY
jgi:hypothetical protein